MFSRRQLRTLSPNKQELPIPQTHHPIAHGGDSGDVSQSKQTLRPKWNTLVAFAVLFLAISACRNPNAIENARLRGAEAGRVDGQAAGQAEGYKTAHDESRDQAYKAVVGNMYDSNRFGRKKTYSAIVIASAFLIGFGFQYFSLYLFRKKQLLFDIDWIVLPKHKTRIDLAELLNPQESIKIPGTKPPDAPTSNSIHE